jgi:hypothetical protein
MLAFVGWKGKGNLGLDIESTGGSIYDLTRDSTELQPHESQRGDCRL